jgi:hypothetical protein
MVYVGPSLRHCRHTSVRNMSDAGLEVRRIMASQATLPARCLIATTSEKRRILKKRGGRSSNSTRRFSGRGNEEVPRSTRTVTVYRR